MFANQAAKVALGSVLVITVAWPQITEIINCVGGKASSGWVLEASGVSDSDVEDGKVCPS